MTPATKAGTLIVGASQAGAQVAMSLRTGGDQEPITLLGAEPHLPYQRPPLSKAYLHGKADATSLHLRAAPFYDAQRITVRGGERVSHLQLTGPAGGGTATTERGERLAFDRLALTVGARPRRLQVPGADLGGVRHLRDLGDAALLRRDLAAADTVVVIGGGFIGLEAAAVARLSGKAVTVVEAAERLIPRAVAPVVSEFYRKAHLRRGTTVLLGAAVAALIGERGQVSGVLLADGRHLPADLVLVGIGVTARTELAEQLGLTCSGGILVDSCARTSNPAVVAAGDCTVLPDPRTGVGMVRLESVQNAVDQAKVAAATLLGAPEPYAAVPWFWSDQYDLKLQIAGLAAGYDEFVVRGDPDGERFSVRYYRDGSLLAVDAVNAAADYLAVRKELLQSTTS